MNFFEWIKSLFSKKITSTTSTIPTTTVSSCPNRYAACFGINDYIGTQNDLKGCIVDANSWQELLANTYGFQTKLFTDGNCTKTNFIETLGNFVNSSKAGDKIVITYSGHGTSVLDTHGDEPDGRDEAICLYDGNLIDDKIRNIINKLNPEASLTFISDSCFSGSVTRAFLNAVSANQPPKPRYLPPSDMVESSMLLYVPVINRMFFAEENMKEILISGCRDNEYSYDAFIDGKIWGAFTYFAIKVIKDNPQATYGQFYDRLRTYLPSSPFPQTPQLECSAANRNKILFS